MNTNDPADEPNGSRRRQLVVGAVVVLAALIAALLLVTGGENDSDSAGSSDVAITATSATTPGTAPATTLGTAATPSTEPSMEPTTGPTATAAPTTDPADATDNAIWPWVETPTRFADPVEAATSFAADYLGFTDPVVGEFQAGDSRSGEVVVAAGTVGPTTVVFVRQLTSDDTWWVLGAAGQNITVDQPEQGAVVDSPLTISGTASAFEGTVDVELRADGNGEPIYEGFVTGSGSPEPGPYEATIEFTSPGSVGGSLVLVSRSPEDGHVVEASALRIFFG
jgi:hypothetical protein